MVREAEEFAEEDKIMKETIDARNGLEGYAYSMKNTVNDEDKLGDKIDEDDKETIEEAVSEAIDWLDENPEAEKEEYEGICNPIVQRLYQEHGVPGNDDEDEEDDDFGDDDDDYDIPDDHDEL